MNVFMDSLGRLLRGVFSVVFGLALLVFTVSLLLAALVVVAGVSLWALLTGRKPTPVMVFQRFRQQSQRYTGGVWPGRGRPGAEPSRSMDVVDVQAHEVPDVSAAPGAVRPGSEPMRRVWP